MTIWREFSSPSGPITISIEPAMPSGQDWGVPWKVVGIDWERHNVAYGFDILQAHQNAFCAVSVIIDLINRDQPMTWLGNEELGLRCPFTTCPCSSCVGKDGS